MEKKKIVETGAVCVLFLLLAWYVEYTDNRLEDGNRIVRASPGEGTSSVNLTLNAEDVLEDYAYSINVEEMGITAEQAKSYFAAAEEEIDESFFSEGESADRVTQSVSMSDTYADGLVSAEWSFDNYHVVDIDGNIVEEETIEDGTVVQATAELSCGKYNEDYIFSFMVYPRALSEEEQVLNAVSESIAEEQEKEGTQYLTLPDSANGYVLDWEQTKEHLVVKVFFFEIVIVILLYFVGREKERQKESTRKEEMMLDYAEVVNKLLILLGSGMSLKQAWNRISARYSDKRKKKECGIRWVYEEMLITSHEISDGESERVAYQKFGDRTGLDTYHRLVRILVQNLQTGSRGLCQLLEQEAETALEERKALARKLGEEAGTKMLLPLMLMLGIVIAIIMVPAMLSFNV